MAEQKVRNPKMSAAPASELTSENGSENERGAKFEPLFVARGEDPYAQIKWIRRASQIAGSDGKIVFAMDNAEVPESWSQLATDIVVSKYLEKLAYRRLVLRRPFASWCTEWHIRFVKPAKTSKATLQLPKMQSNLKKSWCISFFIKKAPSIVQFGLIADSGMNTEFKALVEVSHGISVNPPILNQTRNHSCKRSRTPMRALSVRPALSKASTMT